ncbi:hypothetical protein KAU19_01930 [Candidatus Parcubacteria bacterium]|nr:hypothetical protein [Candidatus Parcubacteria bacterium]
MFLININLAKRKKIIIFITFLLAFFILGQAVLAGDNYDNYGLDKTLKVKPAGSESSLKDALMQQTPAEIIGKVVGAALAFIGILFFILMIYGGFLWMTARGNEQQVEKAKELIIAATIGLIIILAAYAITVYIGEALTST